MNQILVVEDNEDYQELFFKTRKNVPIDLAPADTGSDLRLLTEWLFCME